mmetsp:Transcript_24509/g.55989  ORF Transcript_24509/g.55989 Transcript_24509/m.55989 type:complete len:931 (-) Transcript_24509:147-2939(-)
MADEEDFNMRSFPRRHDGENVDALALDHPKISQSDSLSLPRNSLPNQENNDTETGLGGNISLGPRKRSISSQRRDSVRTAIVYVENDSPAYQNVAIPPWSAQDRTIRANITPNIWKTLFGSNLFMALIFFAFVSFEAKFFHKYGEGLPFRFISCLILINTLITLIKAIPGEDTSNGEVNAKVNSSILVAMTLYPCLGLWVKDSLLAQTPFWAYFNVFMETKDETGMYQWGYIFPFFLWFTTAIILIRDSNYAFTLDRQGVSTDANGEAVTAFFRRNPNALEVWSHKLAKAVTASLWDVVPKKYRPAGGGGRFAFQVLAPVVFMFFYVGYCFIHFAIQEIKHIIQKPEDYTRSFVFMDMLDDEELCIYLLRKRFMVWSAFALYCIIIRAVIGTHFFLSYAVPDKQSFRKRWVTWASTLIESKRRRVLWAARGFALPAVEVYVSLGVKGAPNSFLDWIAYYLFLCIHISFLFEGIGALFFALVEAEKGCQLHTPFALLTELSFWFSYNAYLQPLGTLINVIFYYANKEYLMNIPLREIYSPMLLTERNTWRYNNPFKKKEVAIPSRQELDERMQEWLETWRRKRTDIGRDTDNYTIKEPENGEFPIFKGPLVFHGTLFPTYYEWVYMRDHYPQYLTLLPWEKGMGAEHFLKWYPTYKEEVTQLLREPYDFENRREVWMFGYGSLISPNSPPAGLTDSQRKQIIPYWLKRQTGYRRAWNYRHGPVGINAFGLEKVDEEKAMDISGCVYPMDYEKASDLFSFREEGYELLMIHEDYFEPMHKDYAIPKGVGYIWVCGQPTLKCGDDACNIMGSKRNNPTQDSPILQSYIDTVIEGALRYNTAGVGHADGMRFAASIIASTAGWDAPWFNDRLLAGRPWYLMPKYEIIDGLLATCPASRDGFVGRLRASMEPLLEKRLMLEKEKDENLPWAEIFY